MKPLTQIMIASILILLTGGATPASAQLFGSDEKNWEKVLIELKKINARLVSLNNKDLPTLHSNQADIMEQTHTMRSMLPGIQGKMEELRSNQTDQLGEMQARIGQIETFVQGELARQGELQKGEMSGFKKDVADKFDQLRQGMAQDMEQMAAGNQAQFRQMTQNNDAALAAMKLQLDKQADMTVQVIGHLTKVLEVNEKQYQTLNTRLDGLQQAVSANAQVLNAGFVAIESNNRVVNANTDTITRVLKKGFTDQEKLQLTLDGMGTEFKQGQANLELTRQAIGKLKEILDPKLDALAAGQSAVVSGQKQVAAQIGTIETGQTQVTERFNKLVETTQALLTHTGQVGERLNTLGGKMETGQGDVQLTNQKLGKLIDILKAMAQEQQKFDHLITGQGEIRTAVAGSEQKITNMILGLGQVKKAVSDDQEKLGHILNNQNELRKMVISASAQSGQVLSTSLEVEKAVTGASAKVDQVLQGSQQFGEALADLRRKANVNISRNDDILKIIKGAGGGKG